MERQTGTPKRCGIFQADAFPDDTVGDGGKRFSVQVSRIEPETILHFDKTYLSDGLFYRGPSRLSVLLDKIQPLIGADPRFHALAWFRAGDDYPTDWQARFDEPAHAGGGENA